jgi:DNA-binding transcriptional LysR family regulator
MMNFVQLARIDLNLLVLFDVVFHERHLGRAGLRLHLTTSAISHGLNRLRGTLNDPLFLRTPRGVTPTARAAELAEPIADILARVGAVVASAHPFDPKTSRRRFVIGTLDALAALFLPGLLAHVRQRAPGIDLAVREAAPEAGAMTAERGWDSVRAQLDARTLDLAVIPAAKSAPRIARKRINHTKFVTAARRGHPFLRRPTLDHFCECGHLVVSQIGDARGFVDALLAKQRRSRRVVLTVPNFMLALSLLATSDLLAVVPRALVTVHGSRLGIAATEPPFALGAFDPAYVIATRAALADAGVAWLYAQFDEV